MVAEEGEEVGDDDDDDEDERWVESFLPSSKLAAGESAASARNAFCLMISMIARHTSRLPAAAARCRAALETRKPV